MPRLADPPGHAPPRCRGSPSGSRSSCRASPTTTSARALIARAVRAVRAARHARRRSPSSSSCTPAFARPSSKPSTDSRVWVLGAVVAARFRHAAWRRSIRSGMVVPDPAAAHGCCRRVTPSRPRIAAAHRVTAPPSRPGARARRRADRPRDRRRGRPARRVTRSACRCSPTTAYRFCVLVDAYRVRDPATAATRSAASSSARSRRTPTTASKLVEPDLRVGLQARVGIDAIVGGEPPGAGAWRRRQLGVDTRLARATTLPGIGDSGRSTADLTLT